MDTAQVCDRLRGEETCPFHKGHNITSLCKTCGILVCMKCVMSSEHEGHTFKEITSCLREPTDNLAKHITEIEKRLLIVVDRELSEMKIQRAQSVQKHTKGVEQIKEQRQQAHRQIDINTDSMIVQWDEHSQQVLDVLDKHILVLESLQIQLNEERKECSEILHRGSNILKFDAGFEITKKTKKERIPKPPNISVLKYNKCDQNFEEMLLKAMGILEEVHSKPDVAELPDSTEALSGENMKQYRYTLFESISNSNNRPNEFHAISPIGHNAAWATSNVYYDGFKTYRENNQLYLIDSTRKVVQRVDLDTNMFMIQTHPVTKQVFCICNADNSVKRIDTNTGKSTTIVKCEIGIHRLKVTHDDHVIVGKRFAKDAIYRYKLTGELVNKSLAKFKVYDIDHSPHTNIVAISRGKEGVTLLNSDLTMMKTYNWKKCDCTSAIFDSYGNLVVADYSNMDICVLEGKSLSYIQKLKIDGITRPLRLKLCDNTLWIDCSDPGKLVCVKIS